MARANNLSDIVIIDAEGGEDLPHLYFREIVSSLHSNMQLTAPDLHRLITLYLHCTENLRISIIFYAFELNNDILYSTFTALLYSPSL